MDLIDHGALEPSVAGPLAGLTLPVQLETLKPAFDNRGDEADDAAFAHGQATAPDDWLDTQTLAQILNASEMLGTVREHGHDVWPTKLPPEKGEEAVDIGFSIYREGPLAATEALDTIHGASSAAAVEAGPLAYYGRLFDWLDRRSNAIDLRPIRDILRKHIARNFAIEPGATVLGEEITCR
ncbi:hypothetical protein U879_18870 [Defluviimonas sp. 20V17]|uniref:Uncharacterized protein n=1 Tax=Allgaiera indica TaxID=765699 RepID=A0AAN4ZZU1_9RHOB|nr:hypothetical protein U879_18870 [Defluviimonas sp. 20V17]GHE02988.1 hypothetical protein GCM10008024_24570 [Allgaiera indica]SDX13415.1 hypothetical protein SAMN05444006_110107 [Allgaiera indica]